MNITHTGSDKVHVAAMPIDKVQGCRDCRVILHDKRKWAWEDGEEMETAFWEPGAFVLKRRSGARVLNPQQAAEFPACGGGR